MTAKQGSPNSDSTVYALSRDGILPEQMLDLLPCYVTILDPHHRIVRVNQRVVQDFGQGVGRLCHEVFKSRPNACRICPAKRSLQDKKIHIGEETFQTTGGKIVRVLVNTGPILDENSNVAALVELAADITGLKKRHLELTTLGQSIALLSHGIKNILEGLQGGAYVVNEAIKDGDLALARKGWQIVDRNISDITDAVQNILYSAKNRPLNYERLSPLKLASDAVELYAEKAAALGVELTLEAPCDLPPANLDAAGIGRMLHNLIWNALEACRKNRQMEKHRVRVTVDVVDDAHFMFQIEDTGIGMTESVKRNIFEEFFSTKGGGGTGLGLAVVEKVVNKHGGRIEVDSQQGSGSTFRVILKFRQEESTTTLKAGGLDFRP